MKNNKKLNNYNLENLNWNAIIAIKIAKNELIKMTIEHWKIVCLIRNFYLKFNTNIPNRMLLKIIKKKFGKKTYNSQYLLSLFPKGIAKQASKIAGVPNSNICL